MKVSKRSTAWSAVLVLCTLLIGLIGSAAPAGAAGPDVVVYDSIPSPLAGGYPSQPFQAQQTAAFGDDIRLADGARSLKQVTITMVTWALAADIPSYTTPGDWTDPTGWDHNFTLTLRRVSGPADAPVLGGVIASQTTSKHIPWRPAGEPTCPLQDGSATNHRWSPDGGTTCFNGFAFPLTFDFGASTLPSRLAVVLAFDTQSYGTFPTGQNGPYNSLNVAVVPGGVTTVGTDTNTDAVLWDSTFSGRLAGLAVDTGWTPYEPAIQVVATGGTSTATKVREAQVAPSTPAVTVAQPWSRNDTAAGGSATFVTGPGAAPGLTGLGSLALGTTSSASHAQLYGYQYIGTRLDAISSLAYDTYRTAGPSGVVPSLNLEVDYAGTGLTYTTLVFEPIYNLSQGAAVDGTWQSWDATAGGSGIWWSTRSIPGVNRPADGCGTTPCYVTWASIIAHNPNAKIIGGIGPNVGTGASPNFAGSADKLSIGVNGNVTTFDFEPSCTTDCYVSPSGSDGNGGTSYADAKRTIQAAIDTVQPGGTVHVNDGTYAESPHVTKSLTLESEHGAAVTTIALQVDAGYLGALNVSGAGNDVTIRGFTIVGYDANAPQLASSNIFIDPHVGNVHVTDNVIEVGARDSGTNNDDGIGVLTTYAVTGVPVTSVTVSHNTFRPLHTQGARAFYMNPNVTTFTFTDNTIVGDFTRNHVTEAADSLLTGNSVSGGTPTSGTLGVAGYTGPSGVHATFRANDVSNVSAGFAVFDADNAIIEHNVVHDTVDGVRVVDVGTGGVDPSGVEIHDNSFTGLSGKHVTNDFVQTVDASNNWWGSTAVAANDVTGPVDFTPIQTSGTDTDSGTPGYQGSVAELKVHDYGQQTGTEGRIQEAIDLTTSGGTVDVAPNDALPSYDETATGRGTSADTGPYQFGIYFPLTKSGITVRGVTGADVPITDPNATQARITTNATNSFGTSGVFVAGDDETIQGLEIGTNAPSSNKTIEIIADGFSFLDSYLNDDAGAIYFGDFGDATTTSRIATYHIDGNRFASDNGITIANGAGHGHPGDLVNRTIKDNEFVGAPAWWHISFRGAGGQAWYLYPVGGATISGNHFGAADINIRATGTYDESEFHWTDWRNDNTFDRLVWVGVGATTDLRTFSYTTSVTYTNARQLGGRIDERSDSTRPAGVQIAHTGDTVHVEKGTYAENVIVDKGLTLKGAGTSDTRVVPALYGPGCSSGSGSMCAGSSSVIVLQASGITVQDLTVDGINPGLPGHATDIAARNGIITDVSRNDIDDVVVKDTHVQHIFLRGIYASDASYPNNHVTISGNVVSDVKGDPASIAIFARYRQGEIHHNTVSDSNDGISANGSFGLKFHDNHVSDSSSGIHTDNNGDSGQGVADEIYDNTISACKTDGYGIFVFVPYLDVHVHHNSVSGCAVGLAEYGGNFGAGGPATPHFDHNTVDGTGAPVSSGQTTGLVVTTDTLGYGAVDTKVAVNRNAITGFDVSVDATTTGGKSLDADATCNWWGATAGPNPAVSPGAPVTVIPWLVSSDLDGACADIAEDTAPAAASGNEGTALSTSGTFTLPLASVSASVGTATVGSNGSWSWALPGNAVANDGPSGSGTVTITATATNGSTTTTTFPLTIANVAPTGTFNHPTVVATGATYHLTITTPSDPSTADTTAGFSYAFTCDGGATVVANDGTCVAPATAGTYQVSGTITDKDSGATTYGPADLIVVDTLGVFIEPGTDDFGSVVAGGTSGSHTFTLRNSTDASVTVKKVGFFVTSTNDFVVADATACDGQVIPPVGTCTFTVQFTPQTAGSKQTTLGATFTVPPTVGDPPSAALTGTGLRPAHATLTPASHAFPATNVGDPAPTYDFTLANTGDVGLVITSVGTSGSSTFSVTGSTCGGNLAGGANCTITVTFTPAGPAGGRNGQLVVVTLADNGTVQSTLSGTVVIPPAPMAQLTPSSSDFDDVTVGHTKTRHFTLTNTGGADLALTSIGIDGTPTDWTVDASVCTSPLASGASCDISVTFGPNVTGAQNVVLRVVSNATNGDRTANLTGNGVNPAPAPFASIAPATQEFSVTNAPGTDSHDFTITNTGTGTLTVDTSAALKTTGSSWFAVTANTCSTGLTNGQSCTVTVTFSASAAGDKNGTLHVPSNATNGEVTADLHGTATVPAGPQAHADLAPASHDFTGVAVGGSDTFTFTLTNDGDAGSTLSVSSLAISGSSRFSVDTSQCSADLAQGDHCDIDVTFAPLNTDPKSGTLVVHTNVNDPTAALTGTGVAVGVATIQLTPASWAFDDTAVGDQDSHLFSVQNTGTVTLTGLAASTSGAAAFSIGTTPTDPCGTTLAAGASCNFKVVFAPGSVGVKNGTLKVNGSNASNGLQTSDLTGTGTNPAPTLSATIDPTTYDFGERSFGTTATKVFTVTNTGTGTVHLTTVAMGGSGYFTMTATDCAGTALAAGDTCTVSVRFKAPPTPLTKNGTLTIGSSDLGSSLHATFTGKSVAYAGRPDGTISQDGDHAADYVGRNVYCSVECSQQTQTVQSSKGKTVPYWVRVYNNGNVTDTMKVVGRVGGSTSIFSKVVIKRNDVDITSKVLNGTYRVKNLQKGKFAQFRVWVTLKSNAQSGLTNKFWMTFTSTIQSSKIDVVRAKTKS